MIELALMFGCWIIARAVSEVADAVREVAEVIAACDEDDRA